ncbi:hypothetical protein ABZ153_33265 [Streptomyces sp. NPDC006290]|jgi:peptidoglycan hydrolase-like protein with peptidoglycan-binding domain|uniref:hypothetical protein n=1 Tax=Streptomyces sp. NPDC006290 TaxID=3156745 RepID=UPI0033BB8304
MPAQRRPGKPQTGSRPGYGGSVVQDRSADAAVGQVKEIQKLINDTTTWRHGHAKLSFDGKFGPKTLKAVN